MEGKLIRIRVRRTEAMLTILGVPDVPGTAASILGTLAERGIAITMIVQNAPDAGSASITFTIDKKHLDEAVGIVRSRAEELGSEGLMRDEHIARLSVTGEELENSVGLAGHFFSVLAQNGINVLAINATADVVSCIIEEHHCDKAVDLLCRRFGIPASDCE